MARFLVCYYNGNENAAIIIQAEDMNEAGKKLEEHASLGMPWEESFHMFLDVDYILNTMPIDQIQILIGDTWTTLAELDQLA